MTGPLGTGVQLNGFVFVGVSATVFANVEIDAMDSIGIGAVAITNVKSGDVIPGNHTAKSVKDVTKRYKLQTVAKFAKTCFWGL